jgi:Calx-beta domain
MKKVLLYIFSFMLMLACDTDKIIFNGPYFVRFTNATQTQKESHTSPIEIQVHNAGPALEEDVTVNYKISGSAREGIDYKILTEREKVTIKKGEYLGTIKIQLINNANNILRSQDIIFTLQTVSTEKLQVGQGQSFIGKTFDFTIVDDCILGGTYTGIRGTPEIPNITITSTDCETYTLSNWNINVFTTTTEMDLKFVDNGDNTLTIPQQEEQNLAPEVATIKGSGVVDPTTRKIIMTVILVDFEDQPEVSFTLTPN